MTLSFPIIARKNKNKNRNSQCLPFVCTKNSVYISAGTLSIKTKDVPFVNNKNNKN